MKRVYFLRPIGAEGPIKIGCSNQPLKRLRAVEIWSPMKLEIVASAPGGTAHEAALHAMFLADRLHGEWFAASPALNELIEHVLQHGTLPLTGIPTRPSEWREFRDTRMGGMAPRAPKEAVREKWKITSMVQKAERRAFGFGAPHFFRPEEIDAILNEQLGFCQPPASDEELAALNQYMAELDEQPAAPRNWAAWRIWRENVRFPKAAA
jgi:hypothetical protein